MSCGFEYKQHKLRKELRGGRHFACENEGVSRKAFNAGLVTACAKENVATVPVNNLLTNKLLAGLPCEDFAHLLPHLEFVTLCAGEDLRNFSENARYAFFPESAVISQMHVLASGETTEAAIIGWEGVIGLYTIFNASQPSYWTQALVAGTALRLRTEILKREFKRGGALQKQLLAYTSQRLQQLSQRAICNGCHRVDERLCNWLLLVQDRVSDDQLHLTHEQIANHLGTRRAGITNAANALRLRGIISYNRGLIRILNRQALIRAACECYQTINHTLTQAA